jgi:hypothetical protein
VSFRSDRDIERRLRADKPTPSDELVREFASRARTAPKRSAGFGLAFAGVVSVAMVLALGLAGGLGYAASSVTTAVKVAKRAVAPAAPAKSAAPRAISAGGDQYRPGYGFGDPNHNHDGPPGIKRPEGFNPPPQVQHKWPTAFVTTSFTVDEQAHITINVIDMVTGQRLLITQNKSIVGSGISGPQTKAIQYAVLVPRTIKLKLAIPRSQLVWGHRCVIVITATDPSGNSKQLRIPFVA